MLTIANNDLQVSIDPKGAELTRIYSRTTQLDYLWSGDPAFWPKHSPVLFPIVGTLKDNEYIFEGNRFRLTRHGFARDMVFRLINESPSSVTLSLKSDEVTRKNFPFDFELEVSYTLASNTLSTGYRIINQDQHEMYFSIGGHPAFRLPLDEKCEFSDSYLKFETNESAGRWPISSKGLIEALPLPFFQNSDEINISHELFSKDALVFKYLNSKWVKLLTRGSEHGLTFHFAGFPYLGIWSGNNGNFVCIEPWCGIADGVESDQQLIEKEGINMITPGQVFERSWSVEFY